MDSAPSQQNRLRLALTGDSIITRKGLFDASAGARRLEEMIRGTDVAFTNLEVLPNDFRGDPALESGGSHLAAPAAVLDDLTAAGFNLFSFANNHALDYGISGLIASMRALERRGLAYAGVGRTLEESRLPVYLTCPRGTVAMLSCCSTFASGQEAGAQRPDMQGRPGLNPLHLDVTYEVTQEQIETIRTIAEQSGLERERLEKIALGFDFPPDDPGIVCLAGLNFRVGTHTAVRTVAREKDVLAIAKWVREARGRADIVILSMHGHERGAAKEQPAEFQQAFARRMVDGGADLIVCHGPHVLRGMEIYRGRPIFYSLGNFVGQNELVYKVPADSYDRFRVDQNATPGEMYRLRYNNDTKGFPVDRHYWETVVPICSYVGGTLDAIAIHPVTLGFGEKPHRRGRPRLASGGQADAILERFAALSRLLGTELTRGPDEARVSLRGVPQTARSEQRSA